MPAVRPYCESLARPIASSSEVYGTTTSAELDRLRALDEPLDDLVVAIGGDEQARTGLADLAAVEHAAEQRTVDRDVQVSVVAEDHRRLAAELERDLLHRAGGQAHDLAAD